MDFRTDSLGLVSRGDHIWTRSKPILALRLQSLFRIHGTPVTTLCAMWSKAFRSWILPRRAIHSTSSDLRHIQFQMASRSRLRLTMKVVTSPLHLLAV